MRLRLSLVIMLCFTVVLSASAQTAEPTTRSFGSYPVYNNLYVNDFAGILSPESETTLRQRLVELERVGYEVTVVTLDSYRDYDTGDSTFESFATNLFNTWGVGDNDSDGVMLLIGVEDRKVRIEVGISFENTLNDDLQGIINEFMLPRFRQNNYEQGILDGTDAVYQVLMRLAQPSGIPTARYQPEPIRTSQPSSSDDAGGLVVFLGASGAATSVLGFVTYRRYMRLKPRKCSKCETMMVRLDEVEDDEFLDEGQKSEERLGSVDYDVWRCPSCASHVLYDYRGFSFYRDCPECHYRTLGTSSRVIDSASCYSSGLREVTHSCGNCNYQHTFEEVIPRRNCNDNNSSSSSSSSRRSSSSSSFGGGRSSGGGASGSW
jgi:uncharacterized protein